MRTGADSGWLRILSCPRDRSSADPQPILSASLAVLSGSPTDPSADLSADPQRSRTTNGASPRPPRSAPQSLERKVQVTPRLPAVLAEASRASEKRRRNMTIVVMLDRARANPSATFYFNFCRCLKAWVRPKRLIHSSASQTNNMHSSLHVREVQLWHLLNFYNPGSAVSAAVRVGTAPK